MIEPRNTAITIHGELVELIQRGAAVSLGLMVYDVEADRLVFVSLDSQAAAMLEKFQITTRRIE
jgi:hypothetical protein